MKARQRMKRDLIAAMKARRSAEVATLRTLLGAIDNAEAVGIEPATEPIVGLSPDVPRRELSEEEVRDLLRAEADERASAAALYDELGRGEEAERLRVELRFVERYLEQHPAAGS